MPATPDPTHAAGDLAAPADPSRRFVLAKDSPYIANLAALWAADPKLAAAIEALEETTSYATEPSKSGPPTVSLRTESGRTISLHSRYEPLDEARRLIEPLPTDDRTAYYVHGFGLGYHVQELFDRASSESIHCVLEPDLVLMRTALELRDFTKLIRSGRVMFFWQADKSELFMRLTPHTATISTGFEAVTHAPSLQLQPEFHRQMQTWVGEFIAFCRTNISTLVLNGRRTAENVSRNIAWYAATPSLARLQNAYKGSPAVIVSAGPSLRKNKHLLPSIVGKACIIAVQTTLQPLLEMGVEPQFVTSLDYHDICTRFFENLPKTLRTELVAEPKASSAIFDLNPGPLSLLGNDFADHLLAEMKLNKARLPSGATVAHLAYYLAEYLGCDPIIFIGQDLGFSDGLCYAPGTSYEDVWKPELSRFCTVEMKQWEQIVRDRNILRRTTDHAGRPTYTEERLFTYLQQFERDFARSSARIIDATEGGVLKRGATSMTFAAAIEQFCATPVREAPPPHPGLTWDRLEDCADCLKKRREEAGQIEEVSRATLPMLQEVRDHLDDQPRVNRAIGRIDLLRARMANLGACYNLIMQLTQATELRRFKADRKIESSRAIGTEKQRRQVERDIENVRSVIDASIEFRRLIEQVVAGFEHFTPEIRAAQKQKARAAA